MLALRLALLLALVALSALVFAKRGRVAQGVVAGLWVLLFALLGPQAFVIAATLGALVLLAAPLYVVMGVVTAVCFLLYTSDVQSFGDFSFIIRKTLELTTKEVLLAIPFFVVSGEIMTQGSLATRLVEVAKAAFGWLPGGLAVSAVVGCVFFAAISGSSPVTVIAIGSIMVPAMLKAGYDEKLPLGIVTTAGSLGILIPPSIPMIVYAIMVSAATPVDPTDLFLAGVLPGGLVGLLLAGYAVAVGVRAKLPTEPFAWPRLVAALRQGAWALFLPVIILGGIYTGTFTPTEAAVVGLAYSLFVELAIHRELKLAALPAIVAQSSIAMGALFAIFALALGLNHFLVVQEVPGMAVEWLRSMSLDRTSFLLVVNLFLLVVGCFMDIMSAILIIAPTLAPMAAAQGIDPVHMGIIFILNLEIGYLTPPVGLNLFVSSTVFKRPLSVVIRATAPLLVVMLMGLVLVTWGESFSLGLGRLLEGQPFFGGEAAPVLGPAEPAAPTEEPGKVKTLEELMRDAGGEGTAPPPPQRVKTLEELMREAEPAAP